MPSYVEWSRSHAEWWPESPKPATPARFSVFRPWRRHRLLLLWPATAPTNLSRPSVIQRIQMADTPSRGTFAKEPLGSLDVEPAVQSGFQRIRFLFWKTYFSFNRFKIKFHLITVLPLPLIAHNLFVLTPNWTVQLALDSSFRDLSVHIVCHHVFEL